MGHVQRAETTTDAGRVSGPRARRRIQERVFPRRNVRGNLTGDSDKGTERALDYLRSATNEPAMIVALA